MAKEKDYRALAKKKMHRSAEIKRYPRILVYSRNKKGKTFFSVSAGVEQTLVIDPERGTDEMKKLNPHVWPTTNWTDIDDAYQFLRHVNECQTCPTPHPFKWVALDGNTRMSNFSLKHVMKLEEERSLTRIPGMVQQRDYGKAGELMKDMFNNFHNLPLGVIYTAQERMIEASESEEDEDYEDDVAQFVPDLPKGTRGSLNAIVDVIGRLYVVRNDEVDPPKAERRLWIGDSPRYDTGYRSDFGPLPNYIRNPTIPKLVRLMRTGTQTAKKTARKK